MTENQASRPSHNKHQDPRESARGSKKHSSSLLSMNRNHTNTSLRRYQELDDESILSGIYTESGVDYAPPDDNDDDDEAFRRAVQAEQTRVMREFGLTPPHNNHDTISVAEEESIADASLYTDAYSGTQKQQYQQQQDEEEDTILTFTDDAIKNSTPETYPGSYSGHDASTFQPNTLFSAAKGEGDEPLPLITPRRLKMIMALLCAIVVVAIAVAMGSFLAQDQGKGASVVPNDVQVPDLGQLATFSPTASPTASPTESYLWTMDRCVDHPSHTFFVNDQFGNQDCVFLQSHAAQRNRLCQPELAGHRWCPATCGLCLSPVPSRAPAASMAPSAAVIGTARPTTRTPTLFPTSNPTAQPVPRPTLTPTRKPTAQPTLAEIIVVSTPAPTREPTAKPTRQPTQRTPDPTPEPTAEPTADPTRPFATPEPTYMETVVDTTAEPSPAPAPASFLCRTCPLYICELIPC